MEESPTPSREYSPSETSSVQQQSVYQAPQNSLPSYNVSNTGGTTLVTKCRQLKTIKITLNWVKSSTLVCRLVRNIVSPCLPLPKRIVLPLE